MVKTKHYKSEEAYRKSEAFQHIHGLAPVHGPYAHLIIAGKEHKAKHKRS